MSGVDPTVDGPAIHAPSPGAESCRMSGKAPGRDADFQFNISTALHAAECGLALIHKAQPTDYLIT
jgi:hypothetical protein